MNNTTANAELKQLAEKPIKIQLHYPRTSKDNNNGEDFTVPFILPPVKADSLQKLSSLKKLITDLLKSNCCKANGHLGNNH